MINLNIYKRKDGRYEGRISLGKDNNGKRKYRSFYGKTQQEVEYKLRLADSQFDEISDLTDLTVKELAKEWLFIISSKVKESTIANYRMKLQKHIIPTFGEKQCCLLQSKDIYRFIEQKIRGGLSVRYISDIIVLLKSIFKYASHEYRIRNVLNGIVMPKRRTPEVKLLSKEQQGDLISYINNNPSPTNLGIALSLITGLRIGEICALQWSDIDMKKRTLNVSKTIQRIQCTDGKSKTKLVITEPKSASSVREIPIPECIVSMLSRFYGDPDAYILSGTQKPVEPRTMQYRFTRILKNVNLPSIHFHALRHMFATNCISLGFDVKTLSEILGHSSVEITLNRYVHSSMERKRNCMNLITWVA